MAETGELERERLSPSAETHDHVDIYDEDGLVRQDYLALIGEALEAEDVEFFGTMSRACTNPNWATSSRRWSRRSGMRWCGWRAMPSTLPH